MSGQEQAVTVEGVRIVQRGRASRAAGPVTLVPWRQWTPGDASGVVVSALEDLTALRPHLGALAYIAMAQVPGEHSASLYTQARRLRAHWGFRGHLMVLDPVQLDQVFLMSAVGFDAFRVQGADPLAARRAPSAYDHYFGPTTDCAA